MVKLSFVILTIFLSFLAKRLYWDTREHLPLLVHNEVGKCKEISGVVGAEDIVIDAKRGLAFLGGCDRRQMILYGKERQIEGSGIYLLDLNKDETAPYLLETVGFTGQFHPHGLELLEEDGHLYIFVISHRQLPGQEGDYVEVFEFKDNKLFHKQTYRISLFVSINDIAPVSSTSFYVTNDHYLSNKNHIVQLLFEDIPGYCWTKIVFVKDGNATEVASRMCYPNGIAIGSNNRLYIAETMGETLVVMHINEDGTLNFIKRIPLGTCPDNIQVLHENGNDVLHIASHPRPLRFILHSANKALSPSQVLKITVDSASNATIDEIFLSDGSDLSGSSIAAVYKNKMLIGAVFEPHFLLCTKG